MDYVIDYSGGVKRKRIRSSSGSGGVVAVLILFLILAIATIVLVVLKPWQPKVATTTSTPATTTTTTPASSTSSTPASSATANPASSTPTSTSTPSTPTSTSKDAKACMPLWTYIRSNGKTTEHTGCAKDADDPKAWCQLNNYTSGGRKSKDWFYTDDPNHPNCKRNWNYYDWDGTLIKENIGSITKDKSGNNFCAMKQYYSGGREGIDWKYC